MADFEKAIGYVLQNEGVDSDHPADTGGRTRYGITHKVAREHGFDVEYLTLEAARSVYRAAYWKFDGIADQRVATKLFDMAVNFGVGAAVRLAQEVCRVPTDGRYGKQTERALNSMCHVDALKGLIAASRDRYVGIVAANTSQRVFLNGWLKRAARLPE